MPAQPLTMMVASTVYGYEDQIRQICAVLSGYGYRVWNSHIGTVPVSPTRSNLENCLEAVRQCDCFLGIIRSAYGSGKIGERSITHEECLEAVSREKPRWFLVERSVTIARQLLRPYMFRKDGQRTKFKLKKNPVIDDLRVIDLYHDVIKNSVPLAERKGHWAQEYSRIEDALRHIEFQFKDTESVRKICEEMLKP